MPPASSTWAFDAIGRGMSGLCWTPLMNEVVSVAMVDRLTEVVNDLEKNHHISFKHWATPGNNLSSAALDVARTTCRRAERRVIALAATEDYVNPETIRYLNRLSDVLWLFARFVETEAKEEER